MTVEHFAKFSTRYPWVVISLLAKQLYKSLFFHSYTSFGVWLEITTCRYKDWLYELVMLCYGFPWPRVPICSAKVSSYLKPLLHLVDQITFCVFPHTTEHDSQPIAIIISKQAVPYRTHVGTCCPRVSTPKTWSLADSSVTNYISWQIPTISTFPNLTQTTESNLIMVNSHHNGWKTNTLNSNTSQTQHHKYARLARHS
jgi:hypothetical protein